MRAFTRLASGKLRSGKSKDDAPIDPSYVSVEPATGGGSDECAALQEQVTSLRTKLTAAESQNATLRTRLEDVKGQRSGLTSQLSSLHLKLQQQSSSKIGQGGQHDVAVQAFVPWASHQCGAARAAAAPHVTAPPTPPIPEQMDAVVTKRADAAGHTTNGAFTDDRPTEWTTAGWLRSLDFASLVIAALEPAVPAGCKALDYFRKTASRDELERLLRTAQLAGFTDLVWAAVERLRMERTAAEVQEKFMLDGTGLLEYSDLSTFFGGLEAKVGAPDPKILGAMAAEHTERADSHVEFGTSNYRVKTTSAIEWRFVAEPDNPPPEGWPAEEKLLAARYARGVAKDGVRPRGATLLESGAQARRPMPIAEMKWRLTERSARLREIKEPPLIIEEGFGARLYTGPLFVKYNGVLRGIDSSVPFLRAQFEERCMGNKYTTTLHAINSAIVKLSKLTVAAKVYRGMSGMGLPDEFWRPNKFGVRGGIEAAFMSTTTDRKVAMDYASSAGAAAGSGIVFEVQQGMIDRGADVSFLSMYPHEQEVLFAPLTGLEVHSMRVEDAVLVVSVSLSINLTALTIEQVIGKRHKLLGDMAAGVCLEVRGKLGPAIGPLSATLLDRELQADALKEPPDHYNEDERFKTAVDSVLAAKQDVLSGVTRGLRCGNGGWPLKREMTRAKSRSCEKRAPRLRSCGWLARAAFRWRRCSRGAMRWQACAFEVDGVSSSRIRQGA